MFKKLASMIKGSGGASDDEAGATEASSAFALQSSGRPVSLPCDVTAASFDSVQNLFCFGSQRGHVGYVSAAGQLQLVCDTDAAPVTKLLCIENRPLVAVARGKVLSLLSLVRHNEARFEHAFNSNVTALAHQVGECKSLGCGDMCGVAFCVFIPRRSPSCCT